MAYPMTVISTLLMLLVMVGCVAPLPIPSQTVPPTPTSAAGTESGTQNSCATSMAEHDWVRNEAAGYCLQIPEHYEAIFVEDTGGMLILAPATSQGHRERLFIEQEEALGRTLEEVTGQVLMVYSLPAGENQVSDVSVGGEPAQVIGRLPGQDLNRRLIVVHGGRVYQMMFIPDDPEMGDAYAEMEALYTSVLATFTFIPPTAPLGIPFPANQDLPDPAEAALLWERQILGDGGNVMECQRLSISADGEIWAGNCEGAGVESAPAPYPWADIYARFAPFNYQGGESKLILDGQGDIFHPAWQRALDSWAAITYGETVSGRTGAASRTSMSWWLGEVKDGTSPNNTERCRHLVVLSHGYAYANVDPCQGGESQTMAAGWLQTAEMEAFDGWLYGVKPSYVESNYIDGRGEQEISQEQTAEIGEWAEHVYLRLLAEAAQ